MDIQDVRRQLLKQLLIERFRDNQTDLARAVQRQQSFISELLRAKRPFGEKVARDFELKLDLAPCSLDQRPQAFQPLRGQAFGSVSSPLLRQNSEQPIPEHTALTADEQVLLDAYRLLEPEDRDDLITQLLDRAQKIRRYALKLQRESRRPKGEAFLRTNAHTAPASAPVPTDCDDPKSHDEQEALKR
jgi:hypothetical protein